jgi:hypothetical protein
VSADLCEGLKGVGAEKKQESMFWQRKTDKPEETEPVVSRPAFLQKGYSFVAVRPCLWMGMRTLEWRCLVYTQELKKKKKKKREREGEAEK